MKVLTSTKLCKFPFVPLSLSRRLLLRPLSSPPRFTSVWHTVQGRNYAKKAQSTSLKLGSQHPLTKPADIAEHEKCEEKMKASVEWTADASTRAAGRATPALLAKEVATVGVRDGSMLIVTRQDTRTSRISVPKPTLDAKSSVTTATGKKAEDARVHCRKLHQASREESGHEEDVGTAVG
ncbi:ribosome recycling factor [Armillaria fumosa]|nr:ribosome recycling factor [Armillaria fumosa]